MCVSVRKAGMRRSDSHGHATWKIHWETRKLLRITNTTGMLRGSIATSSCREKKCEWGTETTQDRGQRQPIHTTVLTPACSKFLTRLHHALCCKKKDYFQVSDLQLGEKHHLSHVLPQYLSAAKYPAWSSVCIFADTALLDNQFSYCCILLLQWNDQWLWEIHTEMSGVQASGKIYSVRKKRYSTKKDTRQAYFCSQMWSFHSLQSCMLNIFQYVLPFL